MLRSEVLQPLLDLFEAPRYLEIGVHSGETFFPLRAERKVAVDPAFRFDTRAAERVDPSAEFHPVPSDAYFRGLRPDASPFDVAFIDGLHTFEQTLRDLLNVLGHVRRDSVVVIDDVLPSGYFASLPDQRLFERLHAAVPGTPAAWMGDVYRLAPFIAAFLPNWSYATVAENHGQLVMWREPREPRRRSVESVARATYEETVLEREVFAIAPFAEVLARVRAARERR